MSVVSDRPLAVLVRPPVYDFTLYDLWARPYGLGRLGSWLSAAGWSAAYVDGLSWDGGTTARGRIRRKPDGTGKFSRQIVERPAVLSHVPRRFARYGVPPEGLAEMLSNSVVAEGRRPEAVFVTTGMTWCYPGVRETVEISRRLWPGTPLFCGGTYATLLPDHCAAVCGSDTVIPGEDHRLLAAELERRGLPAIHEPFPYMPDPASPIWRDAVVVRLNRGCPWRCRYCASAALSSAFAADDPALAAAFAVRALGTFGN